MKKFAVAITDPLAPYGYIFVTEAADYREAFLSTLSASGFYVEELENVKNALTGHREPKPGEFPAIIQGTSMIIAVELETTQ